MSWPVESEATRRARYEKSKRRVLRQTKAWKKAKRSTDPAYFRRWYQKNKKAILAQQKTLRDNKRAFVAAFKNSPCLDCDGEFPPYVMEFDHVRGRKILAISTMVSRSFSLDAIRKEIAKCDVVCANCHRERTHKRGK